MSQTSLALNSWALIESTNKGPSEPNKVRLQRRRLARLSWTPDVFFVNILTA
jgi:hypothetical protein